MRWRKRSRTSSGVRGPSLVIIYFRSFLVYALSLVVGGEDARTEVTL